MLVQTITLVGTAYSCAEHGGASHNSTIYLKIDFSRNRMKYATKEKEVLLYLGIASP
jgi:hypothetical protein